MLVECRSLGKWLHGLEIGLVLAAESASPLDRLHWTDCPLDRPLASPLDRLSRLHSLSKDQEHSTLHQKVDHQI